MEVIEIKTTSDRIKEALLIKNMRQADLVEKTGISKGALSSYISGKYEPKQTNTYLIAKALNVNVSWLMGYDVPMEVTVNERAAELSNRLRKDVNAIALLEDYYSLSEIDRETALTIIHALSQKKEG